MSQPKVSVIIPVYNVEKYLNRCIESVVNQTYKNLEIILIDDGSSDNSHEMCDEWAMKDSRIKVIHKENAGAGLARNTGLENATGDYVLFIDSDDYIDVKTAEQCVESAIKNETDIVMYGRTDVDESGNYTTYPILSNQYVFKDEDVTEKVLSGLFTHSMSFGVGVWGKLIRLDKIKNNSIQFKSERVLLSEDAVFLLELFAFISSVSILPQNYYYYFKNDNSFSRTYKKNLHRMNDVFLMEALEICKKNNYSETVKNHLKARYQIYALGGMRQIVASDMSYKEKKEALKLAYCDNLLHSTLKNDVLMLGTRGSKFFWKLFRLKLFSLCYILLEIKTRN